VRVRKALLMAIDRWGGSQGLSRISTLRSVGEKRLFEQAYQQPLLWWYRIVPSRKAVMGWKMSPSHTLGQDLAEVWLNR
jgi:hypothetical protein